MFELILLSFLAGGLFFTNVEMAHYQEIQKWNFEWKNHDCDSIFTNNKYYYDPSHLGRFANLSTDKLLIGVTGLSGMGKSSLINMLLKEQVAKVGQSETTSKAQLYGMGQVILADLPGNSAQFPMQNYSQFFGLKCYHVLILMVDRVSEFDRMVLDQFADYQQYYGQRIMVVYSKPLERTSVRSRSCSLWWEQCKPSSFFSTRFTWNLFARLSGHRAECESVLQECSTRLARHVAYLSQRLGKRVIAVDTRYPEVDWQNSSVLFGLVQGNV